MDKRIQRKLEKRLEEKRKKRQQAQSGFWFWMKQFFFGLFDAALLMVVAVIGYLGLMFYETPQPELVHRKVAQTSIIYDRSGEHVLYEIHGEENRKIVAHNQIADTVRIATIAAEDDQFYSHWGVDPVSVLRAFKVNLEESEFRQGASTITQQLARNVFLNREKSWERKIKEAVIAVKIEMRYSKDEILDFYLNEVPYGSNAYGVQSAAEIYFGKDAANLTLGEAALVVALNKAPTYYSPYGNHSDELLTRQRMILERIRELKMAGDNESVAAWREDALSKVLPFHETIDVPHFVFYVREQLERKYGSEMVEKGGLRVYTTLDYDLQKEGERVVREAVERNGSAYNFSNAALVSVDPRSGEILAMVGSRDFFNEKIDGQVNVVVRQRQPGSSFKPIVYAKAFEKGYQPETLIYDVRTNFGPDGTGKDYIPQNYNGNFSGLVSMRQALSRSLNIPAIKTLYLAGIQETIDLAERLGISTLTRRNEYGLALAIGGGEVTLLEETGAFSVFANDGVRHKPHAIIRINQADGKLLEDFESDGQRVVNEEVARKINSILSDNDSRSAVFGPRSPLYIPGRIVAAKTGTTQDFRDAWTVGYTPAIAAGVWVGNNDGALMRAGADGVFVAAPIWRSFMDIALPRYPSGQFVSYVPFESDKPMITGRQEARVEYFNINSGKKLSDEKRAKTDSKKVGERLIPTSQHEILFYVNKDNPLGEAAPNRNDPMLRRWEQGIGEHSQPSEEDEDDD